MTILGRAKIDHPALGTVGGAGLHTSIETIYTNLANHLGGRFNAYTAIANSTVSTYEHNFGVAFEELDFAVYTGTHPALTRVTDLVAAGWTVIATVGFEKTKIDITTPAAGGPHTFAIFVIHSNSILENKTLKQGVIDNFFDVNEESAPATPSAGKVRVYAKTDKKVYRKGSDGIEAQLGGASGAGGVNYLVSSLKAWDFEDGLSTGWSAYADAAGTSPVDGTGGSPTVTFAASSSSPLRGSFNGLLTKDAANRQGQGASVDFTLDSADKSKPFSVIVDTETSAAYTGSSGTEYARIFVYDVTNAALLPGYIEVPVGAGPSRGFFLATTSTSYRLIFHVAGTGTSAWTMKLDNVQIGPQEVFFGLAGHDSKAYTPTFSNSTNIVTNLAQYSRHGDMLELDVKITTSGGAGAGGTFTVSLPPGLTVDTVKQAASGSNLFGYGWIGTAAGVRNPVNVNYNSSTAVQFNRNDNSSAIVAGTDLAAPGWAIVFQARIPIAEWTSNIQMADRAVEEYAFNTSTSTTTDDTTSFGYGAQGAQIQNVTSALARRVRFQTPVLPTDSLILELSYNRSLWRPVVSMGYFDSSGNSRVAAFQSQNGVTYGIGLANASTDPRDIDLSIGQYAHPSGATFGAAGTAWSVGAGSLYWRIRKVSGGAAVGFPVGARNLLGHIPVSGSDVVPTGYLGELISATQTRSGHPALTTGVQANLVSISLTPGVWDLTGILKFEGATGVSAAQLFGGISTTSASIDFYEGNNVFEINKTFTTGDDVSYPLGVSRMVVSTITTVYLVTRASFSGGSLWHYGTLRAVRVG